MQDINYYSFIYINKIILLYEIANKINLVIL